MTARKLPESAFDIPLKISVLSQEVLEDATIDGLYALAAHVPGLSFESVWGGGLSLPTMRGQFSPGLGDTVGVFVDGVYQASRSALDVELLDFARAEAIFGPQSTLYGHSTFAGAIGYVSNLPTDVPAGGATLEGGTDEYLSAQAWLAGPIGGGWLGRLAVVDRSFDGTGVNTAERDEPLGGFDRQAIAATLISPDRDGSLTSVALHARYQDGRYSHPAVSFVAGPDYNCGSQDSTSGQWSYWCGELPERAKYDISPGLPDSETQVGQAVLKLVFALGTLRLESDTSYYAASSSMIRDFDASSVGVEYGVCTLGTNCAGPPGSVRFVDRTVLVNEVVRDHQDVSQFSQELRLRGSSGGLDWMAGAVFFDSTDDAKAYFGAAQGDLRATERLTAILPATPRRVGPVSIANAALVDNPSNQQVLRQNVETGQRNYSLFGAADYAPDMYWRLRAEVRAAWERLELDSRVVNFQPSFGRAIAPQDFNDVTARFSVEYRVDETMRTYVSAANGSRPGGINPIPGLPADEQIYEPESNWTYELGMRYRSADSAWALDATAFYIDWRNAQINGFPSRPGLSNLIVMNTAGMRTPGFELSAEAAPWPWLRADFSYSYADPRFSAGSDDPGSSAFCGLSAQSRTSTFCALGPPRNAGPNSPALVPRLDGNAPGRAPQVMWHGALVAGIPPSTERWLPWGRVDLSYQDAVYERQIDGASFGERVLLNARVGFARGPWSIEAWGTNLTDQSYVRASFSRLPVFYPTQPRPLDLIYADGRRIGLTMRWTYR